MKNTAKKLKTKKMFAAMQTVIDREDMEDSDVTVIGVYASKKTANAELEKAKTKFLSNIPCEDDRDPEEVLLDDEDRTYNWYVTPVKVEE